MHTHIHRQHLHTLQPWSLPLSLSLSVSLSLSPPTRTRPFSPPLLGAQRVINLPRQRSVLPHGGLLPLRWKRLRFEQHARGVGSAAQLAGEDRACSPSQTTNTAAREISCGLARAVSGCTEQCSVLGTTGAWQARTEASDIEI